MKIKDLTQIKQVMMSEPPLFAHRVFFLAVFFILCAITWAGFSHIDIVVKAPGTVRPLMNPTENSDDVSGIGIFPARDGKVAKVHFKYGELVNQGDLLISLDTSKLDNDIAQFKSTISSLTLEEEKIKKLTEDVIQLNEAKHHKLKSQIEEEKRRLDIAENNRLVDIKIAEINLAEALDKKNRFKKLLPNSISQIEYNEVLAGFKRAKTALEKLQEPINRLHLNVLERDVELIQQESQSKTKEMNLRLLSKQDELKRLISSLNNLERDRNDSFVRAPESGIITKPKNIRLGDHVTRHSTVPLIRIADLSGGLRFDAQISDRDIGRIKQGMTARIKLEAFNYQKYGTLEGTILSIPPDSIIKDGRVIFQVPIKFTTIELQAGNNRVSAKLGITGQAEIQTERDRILVYLFRRFKEKIDIK